VFLRRIGIVSHAAIEAVSGDGVVLGWARDGAAPLHVQVLVEAAPVAEAMAMLFRGDLLRAGHGHGHFGFAARLRKPLPQGPLWLALHLPATGRTVPVAIQVPPHRLRGPATVEALLDEPPSWTVNDLLTAPACIDWDANLSRMGPARFVDGLFRFALGRWPSKAEARLHADTLARRRLSARDLLIDLLSSPERAESDARLPSPFDPAFPFAL
jgi:hypothetical protein